MAVMLSESMRHRLEKLNRSGPLGAVEPNVESASHLRLPDSNPAGGAAGPSTSAGDDELRLPGKEVATAWGPHWQVQQWVDAIWPDCQRYISAVVGEAASHRRDPDSKLRFEDDLTALRQCMPRRAVYLDLETCGFAGSMVFLVGLLHWHTEQLTLTQLWARNYAEEKAILQSLWSIIAENDLLITFNGKSFDWPQVHDRSTLHHLGYGRSDVSDQRPRNPLQLSFPEDTKGLTPLDERPEPWHFDVLHHARRRWRHQLPNCRLQTLERYICGRRRVDDLPGSAIPGAYHEYVRHGRLTHVQSILHHNALDLITLLQLALLFRS